MEKRTSLVDMLIWIFLVTVWALSRVFVRVWKNPCIVGFVSVVKDPPRLDKEEDPSRVFT